MVPHTRHVSTDDAGPTVGSVTGRGSSGAPTLEVNGTPCALDPATTVADLVAEWCGSPEGRSPEARSPEGRSPEARSPEGRSPAGIAVARNGEVVPRSEWTATTLAAGDRVEIVTAVAGG